jgi:hypothetical protein
MYHDSNTSSICFSNIKFYDKLIVSHHNRHVKININVEVLYLHQNTIHHVEVKVN